MKWADPKTLLLRYSLDFFARTFEGYGLIPARELVSLSQMSLLLSEANKPSPDYHVYTPPVQWAEPIRKQIFGGLTMLMCRHMRIGRPIRAGSDQSIVGLSVSLSLDWTFPTYTGIIN